MSKESAVTAAVSSLRASFQLYLDMVNATEDLHSILMDPAEPANAQEGAREGIGQYTTLLRDLDANIAPKQKTLLDLLQKVTANL